MKCAGFILCLITSLSSIAEEEAAEQPQDFKAAVSYMKLLTEGKYELAENTALSPHCELSRRKEIRDQLEFYSQTSLRNGDIFHLEEKKSAGAFTAILLRSENPLTPLSTSIHAIAMLKRNNLWLPAPLPGSFSNTDYGYDLEVEKNVRLLEQWMAKEKIKRETKARESAASKLLREIKNQEAKIDLKDAPPEKVVMKLIEALRAKNLTQALAIMGIATGGLHEPLETSVSTVSRGLSIDDQDNEWSLVTNRSIIAQVMQVDNTKNEVAIGFWDPQARTEEKILYFPVSKSNGKTFAPLSAILKVALLSENERRQQRWRHRRSSETELRKKLASVIFKNKKAVSHPDSEKLLTAVLEHSKTRDFTKFVSLLPTETDYFAQEDNQKRTLEELGLLWKNLILMETNPLHRLNVLEDKSIAMAPLQFARTSRPGEFVTVRIWMTKQDNNWYLLPEQILSEFGGKEAQLKMQKLIKQLQSIQKEQQENQSRALMAKVAIFTPSHEKVAPSDAEAKKLLTSFRQLLRKKDTASALACCAVLEGTERTQTLKIFDYAIRGAADHSDTDEILGLTKAGKWMGVSMRTVSKSSGVDDYPLYLIINTDKGSRILLDIDLRHATNRGRELLNARAWKKLESVVPKASLTEIKSLFKTHKKISITNIAKNNPEAEE